MLSSYPSAASGSAALATTVSVVLGMGLSGSATAAQTYVVPKAELRAESHTNFGLSTNPNIDTSIYGLIADAEALIGIATPRSETSIRPRIRAQEYPDYDDLGTNRKITPIEAFLDLSSRYRTQRSEFDVVGRYSHQDSYTVDTQGGDFDPLDPDSGTDLDSARTRVGETRDRFQLKPTYSYAISERLKVGIGGDLQVVQYSADGPTTRIDYDYYALDGFVSWALGPVSDLTFSVFVSDYTAENDISETNTLGGQIGYNQRWSENDGIEVAVFYQQDEIKDSIPVPSVEDVSSWGGRVTAYRKREVSQWRLTAGRRYVPTSDARIAEVDEFRLQYDRNFSERLSFRGAARYETRQDISPTIISGDRDFARGDLALTWWLSERWYLSGGYSYLWEDRKNAPRDADDNLFFMSVGYRGISPRR